MKKTICFGLMLFAIAITGCKWEPDQEPVKYYTESGSVSVGAHALMNASPGITAQQMLAYCHQYPVYGDIYKGAESGVTRKRLESALDQVVASGLSKAQFLRLLDSTGAVLQTFLMLDGGMTFLYVEEQ
jgi:hypothetical protein